MNNNLTPLERLHEAQRRQLAESGGAHSNLGGEGTELGDPSANINPLTNMKGRCIPGKVDLPKLVQQVSSSATQLAHRGTAMSRLSSQISNVDPSKYGDPNVTPVVVVSPNGNSDTKDIQFCMTINGITCAHCVKIVETVLKGCNGSRSPIEGLLDASADMELSVVLVKIENIADVRRIAHEAARNLSMVGYTAVGKSVTVPDDMTLADVHYVFETTIPNVSPMMGFNWNIDCNCPDNNVMRRDCPRHSQMGPGVLDVFDKTQILLNNFVQGCQKRTGVPCTAGVHCFCQPSRSGVAPAASSVVAKQEQHPMRQPRRTNMFQKNTAAQGNSNEYLSYQQPIQDSAPVGGGGGGDNATGAGDGIGAGAPSKRQRSSMSLHGRMSIGGLGGLSRHLSLTSETTFGRSMSGLSALSIDWENMEDFDVNVDHSAGINNDIINGQQQQQQGNQQGQNNLNQAVGQHQQGGSQDGAGAYGQQQMQQYASANNMDGGPRFARRSSLIKKNTQGNSNGIYNVSFKEMMS